jgi:excisionase family DNA binding protein
LALPVWFLPLRCGVAAFFRVLLLLAADLSLRIPLAASSSKPLEGAREARMIESKERGALRPNEAAAWLGCSRDTLERLIQRGELRSFKIGAARYVSAQELRRFVAEREQAAGS